MALASPPKANTTGCAPGWRARSYTALQVAARVAASISMKGTRTAKSGATQAGVHCSTQAPIQYGSRALMSAGMPIKPGCSQVDHEESPARSSMTPKAATSAFFQGSRPT